MGVTRLEQLVRVATEMQQKNETEPSQTINLTAADITAIFPKCQTRTFSEKKARIATLYILR